MKTLLIATSKKENFYGVNQVIEDLIPYFSKHYQVFKNPPLIQLITKKIDILYIHGCWSINLLIFFIFGKIKKSKIIMSPHGMLNKEALKIKKIKKKIGLFLYQKLILKKSDLIIVNSKIEKNQLRKITFLKNIIIINHGTNFINISLKKKFEKKFVYFSKIHPIKNLYLLVKIWKKSKILNNYSLDIYGKIDDVKYFKKIEKEIKNQKNINYLGSLNNKNKYSILKKYDVMIVPSISENFCLVILEGLTSGLYILVNKILPWQHLNINFGKSILINQLSIEKNVKNLIKNKKKFFSIKGRKNRKKFVFKNYSWDKISLEYNMIFKNLLSKY